MIELDQLVKKFGDLTAVDHISLKIARGEFFGVLGPNAAGKTTMIRLLTGLIKPTSGCARICGFDIQTQPLEARKRLAYVPDFPFLYDKLTAREFFRFVGQLFKLDATRIEKNSATASYSSRTNTFPSGRKDEIPYAGETWFRIPEIHNPRGKLYCRHFAGHRATISTCSVHSLANLHSVRSERVRRRPCRVERDQSRIRLDPNVRSERRVRLPGKHAIDP